MSEPLTIAHSPHWRLYLEGLVQNGRFASLDDAIESGVRLLEAHEHSADRLARLLEEGEREGGFEEWDTRSSRPRCAKTKMPAKRLEIGRRARADLAGIRRFSVKRWDRDQADRYGDELNAAMVGLADGTRIGHTAIVDGYRVLRCKAHMIDYRERATRIQVIRVLHAHQLADGNL